jgi:hypothetical protein
MTIAPIRLVIAYGSRLFRKTICSFPADRFFSNKTGRVFLSGWFLIFCLCASAIAGGDDRPANVENAPVYSQKDDSWVVNAPRVITLAPGIYFIPEVGYYYMDDAAAKEQGYRWYVGVKWQIDF